MPTKDNLDALETVIRRLNRYIKKREQLDAAREQSRDDRDRIREVSLSSESRGILKKFIDAPILGDEHRSRINQNKRNPSELKAILTELEVRTNELRAAIATLPSQFEDLTRDDYIQPPAERIAPLVGVDSDTSQDLDLPPPPPGFEQPLAETATDDAMLREEARRIAERPRDDLAQRETESAKKFWPFDVLAGFSDYATDEEFNRALNLMPAEPIQEHMVHADEHGKWPQYTWAVESSQPRYVANSRHITVTVPRNFPNMPLDFSDTTDITIIGMAAPSFRTESAIASNNTLRIGFGDHATDVQLDKIAGMVSLTQQDRAAHDIPEWQKDSATHPRDIRIRHTPWHDHTGNVDILQHALTAGMAMVDETRNKTAITYYCAHGIGRTGTVLAAYQMMDDITKNKQAALEYFITQTIKPPTESLAASSDSKLWFSEKKQGAVRTTPSNQEISPLVALAIRKVRALEQRDGLKLMAVEDDVQVKALESLERSVKKSMLFDAHKELIASLGDGSDPRPKLEQAERIEQAYFQTLVDEFELKIDQKNKIIEELQEHTNNFWIGAIASEAREVADSESQLDEVRNKIDRESWEIPEAEARLARAREDLAMSREAYNEGKEKLAIATQEVAKLSQELQNIKDAHERKILLPTPKIDTVRHSGASIRTSSTRRYSEPTVPTTPPILRESRRHSEPAAPGPAAASSSRYSHGLLRAYSAYGGGAQPAGHGLSPIEDLRAQLRDLQDHEKFRVNARGARSGHVIPGADEALNTVVTKAMTNDLYKQLDKSELKTLHTMIKHILTTQLTFENQTLDQVQRGVRKNLEKAEVRIRLKIKRLEEAESAPPTTHRSPSKK